MTKLRKMFASMMLAGAIVTPFALAQDNTGGNSEQPRGDREDRGGRGGFDPAQMRERMVERLKEQLAPANDEEWNIIKPKLEKAMTVRFEQMMGNFGGLGRGRGGSGGGGGSAGGEEREPRNDTERASRDLSKILEDKSAAPDTIAAKLTALREARAKAAAEVKASQEDLRGVLTARQEAVLVVNGMLE